MMTQMSSVIEYHDDVLMPDVNLNDVQALMTKLINYDGVSEMSFDDVAHLSSLLPGVAGGLGIESLLTYESSHENFQLAHEALSKGMKATLVAVIAAAIAIILKFFKFRKSKDYQKGGAGDNKKGSLSSAEAYRKELMKTAPVLEKQVEEFRVQMEYYKHDAGLQHLDGEIYPELLGLTSTLCNAVRKFTKNPVPQFERSRDKVRMGELLSAYADLLAPGSIQYQWVQPYNFFFMSDSQLLPHMRFMEELFHFIRVNKSFENTIPDLTTELSYMRYQPARSRDETGPGAIVYITKINHVIENNFAATDMAKAVGITPVQGDNYQTFIILAERFKDHIAALFGTNIYDAGHGEDKYLQTRMQEYYDFLVNSDRNAAGTAYTDILIMADQCAELLTVATDVMVDGKRTNFLSEAKAATESLRAHYKRDMEYTTEQSKTYTSQQVENLGELKNIGVFITTLTRFVADFSRVVDYVTRWDDKLDSLESEMTKLCRILIDVNKILRKIKE